MIKGVIIDLDNTLYNYEVCNSYAEGEVFSLIGKDFDVSSETIRNIYYQARKSVKARLGGVAASHSRLLYIQKTLETLNSGNIPSKSLALERLFWNSYFEKMQLADGAEAFLSYLKSRKVKVCIATNLISRVQMKKIVRLNIEGFIHCLVTSEEAGADKPAANVFLLALEKMALENQDVVILGDDESDETGAKMLGMKYLRLDYSSFKEAPEKLLEGMI